MLNPNLFDATREGDRWVCRPSALLARLHVGLGVGLGVFLLYLAWGFVRAGGEAAVIGGVFLLSAGFVAGLGLWAWRVRHTPLTAERTGRVCYGGRELCPAGLLRAIQVRPARGDDGDWDVCLELDGGRCVGLPGRFFASFGGLDETRHFARELAAAAGVPVKDLA
jgi:hypothetical protein